MRAIWFAIAAGAVLIIVAEYKARNAANLPGSPASVHDTTGGVTTIRTASFGTWAELPTPIAYLTPVLGIKKGGGV